ncbi:Kelch repeat-containing protein [Pyxidicoccus trucidator]|uniref:Kelch repeat-containing protein n=1 Tax=Pyxidicoccus trucidator TaxID=2709662 RepID=UPI0013DA6380|nr:kelch repeat-containing protein [Pyxidicoccus trucidator]
MNRTSTPLLLALSLALLAGCSAPPSPTGSASLSVSLPQALAFSVSRVSITASAVDLPPVTSELVFTDGVWGGLLGGLPAGDNRAFLAQAFDSAGTRLFEGSTSGVTISPEQTALVAITLQQLSTPSPFLNSTPVIDGLVAPATSVPAGGTLSFAVTAHDPDLGDTLSQAWSATAGSFSSTSSASTSWTAPDAIGIQTLTFTVTDSRGLSASLSRAVYVISNQPFIVSSSQSSGTASPGEALTFTVVAGDPRGSALSFSWSASTGLLGTAVDSASTSRILWRAPSCHSEGPPPSITVTVTNAFAQTAPQGFVVTGLPFCGTANWTATGSLAARRERHTATPLLDGTVLVAGGFNYDMYPPAAERYDPATGLWSATGVLIKPRIGHTATRLLDGRVLVVGGSDGNWGFFTLAEVYDPATGLWSETGHMSLSRQDHAATLLPDGKVLVSGGSGDWGFFASAEVYDPATGAWSLTGSMASTRDGHIATPLPDGTVLVSGGRDGMGELLTTAEVYDPATGTWSATGPMAVARLGHKATPLLDGRVLVTGGGNYNPIAAAEVYDPATGTWSAAGSMTFPRLVHTATTLLDGRVLVSGGGDSSGPLATAEVYDPVSNTWRGAGVMASRRGNHTATRLPDGTVLIAGGFDWTAGHHLTGAELYAPSSP